MIRPPPCIAIGVLTFVVSLTTSCSDSREQAEAPVQTGVSGNVGIGATLPTSGAAASGAAGAGAAGVGSRDAGRSGGAAAAGSGGSQTTGNGGGGTTPGVVGSGGAAGVSAGDTGGRGAGMSGAGMGGGSNPAAGSGGAVASDCMTPPPPSVRIGWAVQGGDTTGGGDQIPVVVRDAQALSQNLSGSMARVIHVTGSISGSFNIGSNKTVIGVCGAEIHGHLGLNAQSNVILRNLKVVGENCSDSPSDCSAGSDAIGLTGGTHHVWIDHLDVSDGSDGNLDITQGSDFVTVSWTKFSYSTKRSDPEAGASGHRFSNLIGASDTDALDPGHLNVTYHHCWWAQNVDQRMPRTRRGQIHVFNNLFTASGNSYCTNAGQDAQLLVQNNVYAAVNNPLQVAANGNLKAEGNAFAGSAGTQTANGTGFTPPYAFDLDPVTGIESAVRAGAGPR